MLIIALLVLMVAVLVATFSFALFTSSSANPGNMTTSGIMEQDNSKDGLAILTVEKSAPGRVRRRATVTISNVGDADGRLHAGREQPGRRPGGPGVLRGADVGGHRRHGTEVYNGLLADIRTVDLGTWPAEARPTTSRSR